MGLSIMGCKKEFLNKNPTDRPTEEQIFTSISGLKTAMAGLYSITNDQNGLGTRSFIDRDIMGDDALVKKSNNGGHYVSDYNLNYTVNSGTPDDIWYYDYRLVANCNNILAHIDAVPASTPQDVIELNDLVGQVYALRAFAYFDLIRWFGETAYTSKKDGPGVLISLEQQTDFNKYNLPRSSIDAVYTQIVSDLETAKPLMVSNSYKGYLDINGVYALSARVHLNMGDWAKAIEDASHVINDGKFSLMNESVYLSGFNVKNSETIWNQSFTDVLLKVLIFFFLYIFVW